MSVSLSGVCESRPMFFTVFCLLFRADPNPTTRHSAWSLVVGGTIGWIATYGVNQASVQRYCALPTLSKAKG